MIADVLSGSDINDIHNFVCEEYDLSHTGTQHPLPNRQLQRAIERASDTSNPYVAVATLLKSLIDMHVFEDGNKRTAWLSVRLCLQRLDCPPPAPSDEAVPTVFETPSSLLDRRSGCLAPEW